MRRSSRFVPLVASISIAALLGGCGVVNEEEDGTLSVSLTDAPACGFQAVNVTVQKIRVHKDQSADTTGAGWEEIELQPARKIDLLKLTNGVLEALGQTTLPEGRYTQLRLVLDPNTGTSLANSVALTSDPDTEIQLDTPSAVQSGIKLVNSFEVKPDQNVDLVLDFDACKSVVTKGSADNGTNGPNGGGMRYALKPVVKVIPTAVNGINGYVDTALLPSNVMISAQQNGVVVRSTVPKTTGEFNLARLEPGNYDVVFTADNRATAVVAKVPVANAASMVTLSSTGTPITLPSSPASRSISGAVTLNPVSTTEEVAFVAAKQSFASGPTVTVKYKGADVSNGAYTVSGLPVAAPRLASYRTTLPLDFNTSSNTTPGTGKYAVEASAAGYTARTTASIDVSTADQTNVSFTLLRQ